MNCTCEFDTRIGNLCEGKCRSCAKRASSIGNIVGYFCKECECTKAQKLFPTPISSTFIELFGGYPLRIVCPLCEAKKNTKIVNYYSTYSLELRLDQPLSKSLKPKKMPDMMIFLNVLHKLRLTILTNPINYSMMVQHFSGVKDEVAAATGGALKATDDSDDLRFLNAFLVKNKVYAHHLHLPTKVTCLLELL